MTLRSEDYQIAALFGLILIFDVCERIWPARLVDRWLDLKLDVLSFAFALAVNRISTWLVLGFVGDVTPAFLTGPVNYLQHLRARLKSSSDCLLWISFCIGFIAPSIASMSCGAHTPGIIRLSRCIGSPVFGRVFFTRSFTTSRRPSFPSRC